MSHKKKYTHNFSPAHTDTMPCMVCHHGEMREIAVIKEAAPNETIVYYHNGCEKQSPQSSAQPHPQPDSKPREYHRRVWQCPACEHYCNDAGWVSIWKYSGSEAITQLYESQYWQQTYHGGYASRFAQVMALSHQQSDNAQRCERLHHELSRIITPLPLSLCDIGSGLGVFCAAMKNLGWRCTAIDPDPQACEFIRSLGIHTIEGSVNESDSASTIALMKNLITPYRLVSAIKVLEHVPEPATMIQVMRNIALNKATLVDNADDDDNNSATSNHALLYIEVPDAKAAGSISFAERQEFFCEHCHGFTEKSLHQLLINMGCGVIDIQSLREPSGKLTLWALATPE